MRFAALATALVLAACGTDGESIDSGRGTPSPSPGTPPPSADRSGISVDTSGTDPYVVGYPATWPIVGRATATEGLAAVTVQGMDVGVGGDFRVDVPVSPGVQLVEIAATDHGEPPSTRKANRSLLVADFVPEGATNPVAAALPLTDEVLAVMVGGLEDRVTSLDLAGDISRRPTLIDDEMCRLVPRGATHGVPGLQLHVGGGGTLEMTIVVPDLAIQFAGTCNVLGSSKSVTGEITATVNVTSVLTPPADRPEGCFVGFDHAEPTVVLEPFGVALRGIGADPLFGWLIDIIVSGIASGMTRTRMIEEIKTTADGLLSAELEGIRVLDNQEVMTLFGTEIEVGLCLTDMQTVDGQLMAIVGAEAVGPGGLDGPGAPTLPGDMPPPIANTLFLDANLVAQLVFSAWRGGALDMPGVQEIDAGLLSFLSPTIRERYAGATITVDMEGRLPPVARAAPVGEGDLELVIGDLHLFLKVGDELLFELGTQLRMTLDLVPVAGGELQPTLVDADATAWLLQEPVADVNDSALEGVVAAQVGSSAASLFEGTTIALPDLGGIIVPGDVSPTEGGRYLAVSLGGSAPPPPTDDGGDVPGM